MSFNVKVYHKPGGDELVVRDGGKIVVSGGAIVPGSGNKAAAIAAFTSSANVSAAQITKLNAIVTALKNVGIVATG